MMMVAKGEAVAVVVVGVAVAAVAGTDRLPSPSTKFRARSVLLPTKSPDMSVLAAHGS